MSVVQEKVVAFLRCLMCLRDIIFVGVKNWPRSFLLLFFVADTFFDLRNLSGFNYTFSTGR